jgi:hypothetical protein
VDWPWADAFFAMGLKQTFFRQAFSRKKRHSVGDKKNYFFHWSAFRLLLCVWPALRMMLMNFHCYKTETFFLQVFFRKNLHFICLGKKSSKNTLRPTVNHTALLIKLGENCKA